MSLKRWCLRWQEAVIYLPLLVLFTVAGYVVFANMGDVMAWLAELPVITAHAVAALSLAHLARRRQRRKLTPAQKDELWDRLVQGERGAIVIYLTDTFVWLAPTVLLLLFFWPAR